MKTATAAAPPPSQTNQGRPPLPPSCAGCGAGAASDVGGGAVVAGSSIVAGVGGGAGSVVAAGSVVVAAGAVVKDSIIMEGAVVGRDNVIDHSILDKQVLAEVGCHIGFGDDFHVNRKSPEVLNTGLTIIGKRTVIPSGYKIGRNCIIYDNVVEGDFPGYEVQSGETVRPKRKPIRIKV